MKFNKIIIIIGIITPLIAMTAFSANIHVSATIKNKTVTNGEQITVPVVVDISDLPEKLGSYTVEATWDINALKYVNHTGGTTDGFNSPVVNIGKVDEGILIFAAANPYGGEGAVNIFNMVFEVIGAEGTNTNVDLKFSAMMAAYTFTDLMPYIDLITAIDDELKIDNEFAIMQNYPNPFRLNTKIDYLIPLAGHTSLCVYNTLGQKIRILVDEYKQAGKYHVFWDGKDDAGNSIDTGVYFCTLKSRELNDIKKMQLMK